MAVESCQTVELIQPMYCEEYELFCFNLQSSDIVMKLVRVPDSDYADCHTLTCKGIKAF